MKLEILFRGKRGDNGEWVYGVPYERNGEVQMIRSKPVSVVPESICEYTGLIDKNGVKIYEGDILWFGIKNLVVWWNAESFQWQAKEVYGDDVITKENWLDNDWTNIDLGWIAAEIPCVGKMTTEIIGNIFDNPELLDSGR